MPRSCKALRAGLMAAVAALAFGGVHAQEVTLRLHHFLPASSFVNTTIFQPWCDKIAKDSNNRLKCQIFPSMQLGGTPAQLYDQARDGVADLVYVLPGYTAGRFPLSEVFELPFMMRDAEATSKALWDYVQQHAQSDFKEVQPLAFHVHGPGVFHMRDKPIRTLADFKGLKLRAPTRQTNRFLAALGATPVGMPVPQVSEALNKGIIDGAVTGYDVVPAVKIHEVVKFHSETDPSEPALYTSTFMFVMNKAKYDGLPPELKKVIDANSGQALSAQMGKAHLLADIEAKKLTAKNTTNVISKDELQHWKKSAEPVVEGWIKDVDARGANGRQLVEAARALIAKHSAGR